MVDFKAVEMLRASPWGRIHADVTVNDANKAEKTERIVVSRMVVN